MLLKKLKNTITSHISYISNSIYTIYPKEENNDINLSNYTAHSCIYKVQFVSDPWTEKVSKSRYLSIYSTVNTHTHTHKSPMCCLSVIPVETIHDMMSNDQMSGDQIQNWL